MFRKPQLLDPTLPGAPVAIPLSRWTTWRCARDGRADRKGPGPAQSTGHLPYTHRHHGETGINEAMVGRALHSAVAPIDREFVSACARIARHNASADRSESMIWPLGEVEPGTVAASVIERDNDAHRAERDNHRRIEEELSATLSGLLTTRQHLIDSARALVRGHSARFTQVAAAHRRGYDRAARRGTSAAAMPAPMPVFTPSQPWYEDDMPILVSTIDPATREVIEWAKREFDPPCRLRAV